MLFTTYGWFIGILLVVGFALVSELLFKWNDESGGQAAVGFGMGAGVGFMQWLTLQLYLKKSQRLFWCTFFGVSLAFIVRDIIASLIVVPMTVEMTIPFSVLFGAFISGWLQYEFVFKIIMNRSVNWIFYNIVGWLLATVITMSTSMLNLILGENNHKVLVAIIALLFLTIGGPILGYITGRFILNKINDLNENNRTKGQQSFTSMDGELKD